MTSECACATTLLRPGDRYERCVHYAGVTVVLVEVPGEGHWDLAWEQTSDELPRNWVNSAFTGCAIRHLSRGPDRWQRAGTDTYVDEFVACVRDLAMQEVVS